MKIFFYLSIRIRRFSYDFLSNISVMIANSKLLVKNYSFKPLEDPNKYCCLKKENLLCLWAFKTTYLTYLLPRLL